MPIKIVGSWVSWSIFAPTCSVEHAYATVNSFGPIRRAVAADTCGSRESIIWSWVADANISCLVGCVRRPTSDSIT